MSAVSLLAILLPVLYAQKFVNAPDNMAYWSYECNSTMCQEAIINCPTHAICNISCDVSEACRDALINWPTNDYYGTISCVGDYSCLGVNFPHPDPNQDFTLNCGGVDSCGWAADIYCPSNASCNINCYGESSCYLSTINWSHPGTGTISCGGLRSCVGVNMPRPESNTGFTFFCQQIACLYATIYCPTDANCNIQCSTRSCQHANIICPINANCNIACLGIRACQNTNISWTYWTNGINTLICDDTDACVNATEIPPMSSTGDPTYSPTYLPTYLPSRLPTNMPTHLPTDSPTRSPTNIPTYLPIYPETANPTYVPTYLPPTYSPSIYPVNQFRADSAKQNPGFIALYIAGSMVLLCVLIFVFLITCKMKTSQTMADEVIKDVEMLPNTAITGSVPKLNLLKVCSVSSATDEHEKPVDFIQVDDEQLQEPGNTTPIAPDPGLQHNELENWLNTKVELPEYYNVFIENGYEKLTFIAEIKSIQEIYEIGVVKKGHQKKIMAEIGKLRRNNGNDEVGNYGVEGRSTLSNTKYIY